MKVTLQSLQETIMTYGAMIDAPFELLVLHSKASSDGSPFLELCGEDIFFVSVERGIEFERLKTQKVDTFLYWFFKRVVSHIAYSATSNTDDRDQRRTVFDKEVELLSVLDKNWGEMRAKEHKAILLRSPFDDNAQKRVELNKKLISDGLDTSRAYEKACETYPLPQN
ncbi:MULTISPECIES: Imm63 family immunity protein [unclassified Endozoicomonas]|uniref:Imm63 family immunity protein n=1 Tax=unclassified Endozoicomonas TaxID=2644528 RepID=UPI003BB52895